MLVKIIMLLFFSLTSYSAPCKGHFVNPVTDICWSCLFPLSIGNSSIVNSHLPDTQNAKSPIGVCSNRIGLNIGYWEPIALTEVTDTPYCLVNLGGHKLNLGLNQTQGGSAQIANGQNNAFYNVHWYQYPLVSWLNLITSAGCLEGGDLDIAYLTELDPAWHDSEMSLVLNPDAALYANPASQALCGADSIASSINKKPMDELFWCAGSHGSHYPLNGFVNSPVSPVQSALLLTERLNFKLHRELLITDSSPEKNICSAQHLVNLPKSRYRYEMVNQVVDGRHCYPSGASTLEWETGKIKPHTPQQYGFLVWRKRNCVFL